MNKLLLGIFVFTSFFAFGQISPDKDTAYIDLKLNKRVEAAINVKALNTTPTTLAWKIILDDFKLQMGWTVEFCDCINCSTVYPSTDTCPKNDFVSSNPAYYYSAYVTPTGNLANRFLTVVLWDINNPAITDTITFATRSDAPPAAPVQTRAVAESGKVTLNWNANTESDLKGYNVMRSTTSGSGYTKINTSLITTNTYVDASVTNATKYFYVITAIDTAGGESDISNEWWAIPSTTGSESGGTSVRELNSGLNAFKVFPNPSNGKFSLLIDSENSLNAQVKIVSATGQEVFNQEYQLEGGSTKTSLEVNDLSSGVYRLILTGDKVYYTETVLIK